MNKNLVEAAGLSTDGPKTWEEFYQYAEAMTDPENGVYGWGQDFDTDAWIWESMLYSYGGEIIFDMHPLRIPAKTTTVGFYIYKPSDRSGVVGGVKLSLPI